MIILCFSYLWSYTFRHTLFFLSFIIFLTNYFCLESLELEAFLPAGSSKVDSHLKVITETISHFFEYCDSLINSDQGTLQ
jgi:hypothetical protein